MFFNRALQLHIKFQRATLVTIKDQYKNLINDKYSQNISTDLKLKCNYLLSLGTEFDKDGNVMINDREFSKLDLCNKVCHSYILA